MRFDIHLKKAFKSLKYYNTNETTNAAQYKTALGNNANKYSICM